MKNTEEFIKAYHDFRDSVDLTQSGILPDINHLVWYMIIGVPRVPADNCEPPAEGTEAIEQRIHILKAVFVEVNKDQPDEFINNGLSIYDRAGDRAKRILQEGDSEDRSSVS